MYFNMYRLCLCDYEMLKGSLDPRNILPILSMLLLTLFLPMMSSLGGRQGTIILTLFLPQPGPRADDLQLCLNVLHRLNKVGDAKVNNCQLG